jgi:hypothetical protein
MAEKLSAAVATAGATLRNGMRPGDIGEIIRMHGLLYSAEHGYSMDFEAYVAKTFAGYSWPLGEQERLWIVEKAGAVRTEERYELRLR